MVSHDSVSAAEAEAGGQEAVTQLQPRHGSGQRLRAGAQQPRRGQQQEQEHARGVSDARPHLGAHSN